MHIAHIKTKRQNACLQEVRSLMLHNLGGDDAVALTGRCRLATRRELAVLVQHKHMWTPHRPSPC